MKFYTTVIVSNWTGLAQ